MSMKLKTTAFAFVAAAGVSAFMALSPVVGKAFGVQVGTVQAQEDQAKKQQETRKTPALRNKVYEKLQAVQVAAEAQDLKLAKELLEEMRTAGGKNELNSYELANMWNMYAFIYYSEENYPKAIEAYNNLIAQPDIPVQLEINTKYSIAQLYFVTEDYKNAVRMLAEWFKVADNPNADAYMLMGQGYYQLKQWDNAIKFVEQGLAKNAEKGKDPKEQWLLLARVLYFEKGNIPAMVNVLETLVRLYPKGEYWIQLSMMYGEQKKELLQLATLETAYVQNMLTRESELLQMAGLYAGNDVPYKASKVMEKGIKAGIIKETSKNLEYYGNFLTSAQEIKTAVGPLQKAADKAEKGEPAARLANVYISLDRFAEAEAAAKMAIKKGDLRNEANTMLVLGQAQFYQQDFKEAKKSFRDAAKDQKTKKFADQWIKYLDSEVERIAKMNEE